MAAGDVDAAPRDRTDVSSLTEIVSLVMGDSGSGVDEAASAVAAAGKERLMSQC